MEFSLVFVVFMMILLATIDWGFYLYSTMILDGAVRDGARTAVTCSDWSANYDARSDVIKDIVMARTTYLPLSVTTGLRGRINIQLQPDITNIQDIVVSISNQPFRTFGGFLGVIVPQTISVQAIMRYEEN